MHSNPDEIMTVGPASRILELSTPSVYELAKQGELPFIKTMNGIMLFNRKDVEKLAAARAKNPPRRGRPKQK